MMRTAFILYVILGLQSQAFAEEVGPRLAVLMDEFVSGRPVSGFAK